MSGALQAVFQNVRSFGPLSFMGYMAPSGASFAYSGSSGTLDSSGNIYTVGSGGPAFSWTTHVVKQDASGSILWQRKLTASGSYLTNGVIAVDSSGNVYVTGARGSSASFVVKYNSSGTIQWQREVGTNIEIQLRAMAFDSSGNVYCYGNGAYDIGGVVLFKFNSSGTLQYQYRFNTQLEAGGIAVSGTDIHMSGTNRAPGSYQNTFYCVFSDTSRTVSIARAISYSTKNSGSNCITLDSSNNVYIGCWLDTTGAYAATVAKYNSSGTLQWVKQAAAAGEYNVPITISHDGTYVYFNTPKYITRWDGSGNLNYQRTLTWTLSMDMLASSVQSAVNQLCLVGSQIASGYTTVFSASVPPDGSKTGTYSLSGSSYVYSASSLTAGNSNLGGVSISITPTTISANNIASSYTDEANNYISTKVTL